MTKPSLFLLIFLFLMKGGFAQTPTIIALNDLSIEAVQRDGQLRGNAPKGIAINIIQVKFGSRSLADVLKNNGIFYDGESYGLVLRANNLSSLDHCPADALIKIPAVKRNEAGKKLSSARQLVRLTLDKKVKQSLYQHIALFQRHLADYTKDIPDSLNAQLQNISGILSVIELSLKSRSKAVPASILKQVNAESALLDNMFLQNHVTGSGVLIADIYRDLLTRSTAFNESKGNETGVDTYPEVDIRVNVLDANGKPVKGLRVCLVPPALYGAADEYEQMPTLSSPSSGAYPVANYVVWATATADLRPVTDLYRLELKPAKKGSPLIIELKYQKK